MLFFFFLSSFDRFSFHFSRNFTYYILHRYLQVNEESKVFTVFYVDIIFTRSLLIILLLHRWSKVINPDLDIMTSMFCEKKQEKRKRGGGGGKAFLSIVSNIKTCSPEMKRGLDYSGLRCEYDLLSFTTIRALPGCSPVYCGNTIIAWMYVMIERK